MSPYERNTQGLKVSSRHIAIEQRSSGVIGRWCVAIQADGRLAETTCIGSVAGRDGHDTWQQPNAFLQLTDFGELFWMRVTETAR